MHLTNFSVNTFLPSTTSSSALKALLLSNDQHGRYSPQMAAESRASGASLQGAQYQLAPACVKSAIQSITFLPEVSLAVECRQARELLSVEVTSCFDFHIGCLVCLS